MSRIDKLIIGRGSESVQMKALGELGEFVRGNGLQKSDLTAAGSPAIHYGQIHTHYGVWADSTKSFTDPDLAGRLRRARPGDLVIATTSEDDAAVGKATAWIGEGEVVVSSDAFIYRHSLDPRYVAYFFQSKQFHDQKTRHISGTKVRRISGSALAKLRIPVPPLEVQREIVRVLDQFSQLEAELEAELEARRAQYEHYRTELMTFGLDVAREPLGELAIIGTGSRNTNEALADGPIPFFVRSQEPLAIDEYEFDEQAVITAGDGVGVGKVFHFVDGKYALHQRAYRIVSASDRVTTKFLFHFFRADFAGYLGTTSVHASVTSLRKPMFEKYLIPIVPIQEQSRIVDALDKFDALLFGLNVGLPAELAARRKQYEYYRDKLLTFEEASA